MVRGILVGMIPPRSNLLGASAAMLLVAALVTGSALAQAPPAVPPKAPPAAKDAPKDAPKKPAKDAKKDDKKAPPPKKDAEPDKAKSAEGSGDADGAAASGDAEMAKYAKIAGTAKFKDYVSLATERQKLFQKSSNLRMAMRGTEPSKKQLDDLASINGDLAKVNERMDGFMTGKTFTQDELMAMEWIVAEQMRLHPLE